MTSPLLWLLALVPLALVGAGLLAARTAGSGRRDLWRAELAAGAALAGALAAALALAVAGPIRTGTAGWKGVGLGIQLDPLSAVMLVLVAFVGLVVLRFSRNYLDGNPGQGRFARWLCLTLAAVLALVLSGNLLQLWLAWIATSLSLHKLLLFYPERPAAVLAARKKFVASRLGDALVLLAMALLHSAFGTLDIAALANAAASLKAAGVVPAAIHAASVCLVAAALLKSAQFPTHGWLTEVMETPTPVSALLHAGVINAGGFLVLRLAGLISLSTPSLDLMVAAGGLTALFGSAVMLTQTSVKVALAYSTIAQMGFMMLELGLGAFSAALLHVVAHSLYKAHAFLSSGSVVDLARAGRTSLAKPHPARTAITVAAVLALTAAIAVAFGSSLTIRPGAFALSVVLALGLTHLVTQALDDRPSPYVLGRVLALAGVVAGAYFALQLGVERLTAGALPATEPLRGPFDLAIVLAVLASFAAVTVLQSMLPDRGEDPRWLALYVHLSNGLYVNTIANRLAIRLWPNPAPRPALPPRRLDLAQGARP